MSYSIVVWNIFLVSFVIHHSIYIDKKHHIQQYYPKDLLFSWRIKYQTRKKARKLIRKQQLNVIGLHTITQGRGVQILLSWSCRSAVDYQNLVRLSSQSIVTVWCLHCVGDVIGLTNVSQFALRLKLVRVDLRLGLVKVGLRLGLGYESSTNRFYMHFLTKFFVYFVFVFWGVVFFRDLFYVCLFSHCTN